MAGRSPYNPAVTPTQRQLTRNAGVVMAAFVLSNLTGLVRQILIANQFGTGFEIDAFYAAQTLPDILFALAAGGALASAFVPTFTEVLARPDPAAAWRLASSTMTLVSLVLAAASAVAALAAPWLVTLLAPGFERNPGQMALAVDLLRILLLSPTLFGISGLIMGILNAHGRFLAAALAPTFYWLGTIAGLLFLTPTYGIYGLAWGAVLGAALHLGVQLPALFQLRPALTPQADARDPLVRQVVGLMGPRLVGVGAVQLNFVVSTNLASALARGSLTALKQAWQIFSMPQVVLAQALGIAILPTFSAQAARGDLDGMRRSLNEALRLLLVLALPATAGLLLLGQLIVRLLFEYGRFDAESTALVSTALVAYSLGLISHSVLELVVRGFYALKDTWTPVWVGALAMLLNVVLSIAFVLLFGRLGHAGLALANTVATTLEVGALGWMLRGRLHGLELRSLAAVTIRSAAAALVMAAVLFAWLSLTTALASWAALAGGLALGVATYWLLILVLGVPEARQIPELAWRRLRRGGRVPPAGPATKDE